MLKTGDEFRQTFSFTQDEVVQFSNLTQDTNPLHLDKSYAADTIFKKPIIHGFLSASIFSKILGTQFPGEGTIYLKQDLEFLRPMFVEENYIAILTIKEIFTNDGKALIETLIKDQRGKITIKGEATVLNKIKIILPGE